MYKQTFSHEYRQHHDIMKPCVERKIQFSKMSSADPLNIIELCGGGGGGDVYTLSPRVHNHISTGNSERRGNSA